MNEAIAAFLEIPGQWSALVIGASLTAWICLAMVDRTKIKELAGYVGGFAVGFALIQFFLRRETAQPLIVCSSVSDVVASCNGWVSYTKGVSDLMLRLSSWYGSSFGESDRYIFALGVVAVVFHLEIGKRPFGTGQDVLRSFLMSAGILFIFNYAGMLSGLVNGLIDSVLSLSYRSQGAAIQNAARMIEDMAKVQTALEAKDFLATAMDTATGLNGGGWQTGFMIGLTKFALGLASIVNIGLFLVQSIILYALPALALISLLIGNFSLQRVFSYIVFSSLLRVAAMLQLICFSGMEKQSGQGAALLDGAGAIAATAVIAAAVGIFMGIKLVFLIVVREAIPVMSGTPFRIGGR